MENIIDLKSLITTWPFQLPDIENFISPTSLILGKTITTMRVALIDTGVDKSHPCFKNATIISKDFSGDSNPMDETGHGTHCAAILAAQTSSGMTGLLPKAFIYSAKVLSKNRVPKSYTERAITNAIMWAIEKKVQIVLITLGCRKPSTPVKEAIDLALSNRIIVVSAAGNHSGNLPLFPSSASGVICVSALGRNGLPLPECYKGELVDVFVPGEAIISAGLNGWREMSGSSQAAAIFCGLLVNKLSNSA